MSDPSHNSPILIVDDDQGLLFSMRTALLSAGLPDPVMVSDARQVLHLVREHQFQLALLDLIMPNMNGVELDRLRSAMPPNPP